MSYPNEEPRAADAPVEVDMGVKSCEQSRSFRNRLVTMNIAVCAALYAPVH